MDNLIPKGVDWIPAIHQSLGAGYETPMQFSSFCR